MTIAYYNEIDPYAAQWLRNLIDAGHIAPGVVDTRSIEDVTRNDLKGFTQVHMFAGIGGWSLALRNAGWSDNRHVWTGSCPCQPFSQTDKRAGVTDERHLWPSFYFLIEQCRPEVIFGEQVASKDGLLWLDTVHADMERAGYAMGACDLCAAGFGSPQIRQRLYWVGDSTGESWQRSRESEEVIFSEGWEIQKRHSIPSNVAPHIWSSWGSSEGADKRIRAIPTCYGSPVDGVPGIVGRLRSYGNAVVVPVAEAFISAYMGSVK
ncbi:DNA cytosine methyltransferase [Klebsiella grimontii]|uniref:DNA cytosine methyltransferase n=1 Tax=Klebsiella grimontii TaxID=2058152 RepID=UPI00374436BA